MLDELLLKVLFAWNCMPTETTTGEAAHEKTHKDTEQTSLSR
jgi:hypothetical protein